MTAEFTKFNSFELTGIKVTDRVLGHGSYATVLELQYLGLKCAGKKIHEILLMQGNASYTVRRFEEECNLLSQIRHPNIVQFLGVFFQPGQQAPILVMEFLPTNLTSCIEQYGILPSETSYSILYDVALGLSYLHNQTPPIIHRDLSSNNVLLTSNMTAKISDLGVARMLNLNPLQVSHMTQTPGTPAYMPPEVMVADPKYITSVDEFSYGVMMIHVFSGKWPEPQVGQTRNDPHTDKLIPVSEAERREVFIEAIGNHHPLMSLILKCLSNNPIRRARVSEIVQNLAQIVAQVPASFPNHLEMLNNMKSKEDEMQSLNMELEKKTNTILQMEELVTAKEQENKQLRHEKDNLILDNATLSSKVEQLAEQVRRQEDTFNVIENALKHCKLTSEKQSGHVDKRLNVELSGMSVLSESSTHSHEHTTLRQTTQTGTQEDSEVVAKKTAANSRMLTQGSEDLGEPTAKPEKSGTAIKPSESWMSRQFNKAKKALSKQQPKPTPQQPAKTEIPLDESQLSAIAYPVCVGKFDFTASTQDDLSFKKGDLMYIISTENEDWWFARLKETGKESYIPCNYVAKKEQNLDTEKWFAGIISLTKATELLMMPSNQYDSYLVLQKTSKCEIFILCVRDQDKVRHYIIRQQDDTTFCMEGQVFTTIQNLIVHYQQQADGLCVNLRYPCILEELQTSEQIYKGEIDRHQVQLLKRVGHGVFDEVWEGIWNGTTPVAVRSLKPGTFDETDVLKAADVLKELQHPNVIRLYGVSTNKEPIYIVTEFMKHGSLLHYLRADTGTSLKLPQLINIAAQVADGMAYLEKHNYLHRDLAARNILVGDGMICKVAEFKLATLVDWYDPEDESTSWSVHKPAIKWTAPEALLYNRFSIKSDVWSFGIVLHELITHGHMPYIGMSNSQALEKVEMGYRMPRQTGCPDNLYHIMLACWSAEPADRPTFETLKWQLQDYFTSDDGYTYVP